MEQAAHDLEYQQIDGNYDQQYAYPEVDISQGNHFGEYGPRVGDFYGM